MSIVRINFCMTGLANLSLVWLLGCDSDPAGSTFGFVALSTDEYESIDAAPLLLAGDGLPDSVDLSGWLPPARDQGQQSACVGFVTGYALKTYQEARERAWDVRDESHQFSPSFIFNRAHQGCTVGSTMRDALELLRTTGCVTIDTAPYDAEDPEGCQESLGANDDEAAEEFRIQSWKRIAANDLAQVKAYLAAGVPVPIGIRVYPQWEELRDAGANALYDSSAGEKLASHAVLAIGYDDDRQAIRIFNSYGSAWGDEGFAWILYDLWPEIILEAYIAQDFIESGSQDGGVPPVQGPLAANAGEDREVLTAQKEDLGDEHQDVAITLNLLAEVLRRNGDLAKAADMFQQALTLQRKELGDDHPAVARTLNNLAGALHAVGDLEGAVPLLREALARSRKRFGDRHPFVAINLLNLATLLKDKGDHEEAGRFYTDALSQFREFHGAAHPAIIACSTGLANLYQATRDFATAERHARDALELQKLRLPEDHPEVASTLNLLGRILAESGQCERAESLLRQSLAIRRERLPKGHWETTRTQDMLAQCAVVQERYDEAEKLFREIRALRRENPQRRAEHDPKFQLDHGFCLLKLERYEEAEPLFLESYEAFTTAGGDSSAGAQSALRRLVELYDAWARPDDAAKYRALLESLEQIAIDAGP